MSGGFDKYGDYSNIPQRLDKLIEAVKNTKADLVSLIDTYRWTEVFKAGQLENIFGYQKVFGVELGDERLKQKGHENGITVMTNLEKVENFNSSTRHNQP